MATLEYKSAADAEAKARLRAELSALEGRNLRHQLRAIYANPLLRKRYGFEEGELDRIAKEAGLELKK